MGGFSRDSGNLERGHLALDPGAGFVLGDAQIVERLETQPEFGTRSEVARQAQRGIRGNAAPAAHDCEGNCGRAPWVAQLGAF